MFYDALKRSLPVEVVLQYKYLPSWSNLIPEDLNFRSHIRALTEVYKKISNKGIHGRPISGLLSSLARVILTNKIALK